MHTELILGVIKRFPIKWLLDFGRTFLRARSEADIAALRRRSEAAARASATASAIRGGRVALRTTRERRAALSLESEGHGRILGDIYEVWVDATPRVFQLAAAARAFYGSPHRFIS